METLFLKITIPPSVSVLILPMRNGNRDIYTLIVTAKDMSSYPTYEEWKHADHKLVLTVETGSYPTYEEWKQKMEVEQKELSDCSYPTYEEWKHSFDSFIFIPPF